MSIVGPRWFTIHTGPDGLARYRFTMEWDTDRPAFCSFCGGVCDRSPTLFDASTLIVCQKCGRQERTMRKGQVFFAKLDDYQQPGDWERDARPGARGEWRQIGRDKE